MKFSFHIPDDVLNREQYTPEELCEAISQAVSFMPVNGHCLGETPTVRWEPAQ